VTSSTAERRGRAGEATIRDMRVVVVGGGIAGLSAALRLREGLGSRAEITVVDRADRLGGKLWTGPFGPAPLEAGAESFLVRDPDGDPSAAVRLAERVGLGDALRHPTTGQAALAIDGELRAIPAGTLMGIPADPAAVSGVVARVPDADRDEGHPVLAPGADVSVGALVRARLGEQVLDRLVDPLLGGVYAGRGDDLSLATTIPALASACRTSSTLGAAVRSTLSRRRSNTGPVFATIDGGMGRLVDAVASASGARLRLGATVRELHRSGTGWRLVLGPRPAPEVLDAEAVVLAVPARPAARLLGGVSPDAAAEIGVLDYASVALVALAVRGARLPELSGFLVPASQGCAVKALTIFTTKWGHLDVPDGLALLRASVGRYREEAVLHQTDDDLAAHVHAELGKLLGAPLPPPERTRVSRWGGALPQYAPGHLDRVARARAALEELPGLVVAGAAYDGVGIPACVRSGEAAAAKLVGAAPVGV
jgi:protoporphyrinogen/coproporphyrinogen III oxidase